MEDRAPPTRFVCPLTLCVMEDPVMTRSGLSFERSAILQWLSQNSTCPVTRLPMLPSMLAPNVSLGSHIRHWRQQQEEDGETRNMGRPLLLPEQSRNMECNENVDMHVCTTTKLSASASILCAAADLTLVARKPSRGNERKSRRSTFARCA